MLNAEIWISFGTLSVLEVVLGIDNIIFIAILAGKLPPAKRELARRLGLLGAFVSRLGLLFAISWIIGLVKPLFTLFGHPMSGKSLVLIAGGGFLIAKATREIHHKLELASTAADAQAGAPVHATFRSVIIQAMVLDLVFSLDSVITAVGMTPYIGVMIAANVVALVVMLALGGRISRFIEHHPSVKMLALAFLLMIGLVLIAEGFGQHISKGYIYGAMAFSVLVELLNLRSSRKPPESRPAAATPAVSAGS